MAFVPGSGEIAMTGMDPTQSANSGGISWFNNTTGKRRVDANNQFDGSLHGYRLYDQALPGNFGKAAGLGDLEVFCASSCTQPTLTIVNPSAVCTPNTVNITTAAVQTTNTGVTTTYWKDAAATIALDGASGAATAIQLSGTYYIKSSTSVSTCFIVQPVTVTVNPLPNFTLASTNVTCNGFNNGTIIITTTSGLAPFTFGTDDGATFPNTTGIFNNLTPAAYKPAVRDADGCVRKCN